MKDSAQLYLITLVRYKGELKVQVFYTDVISRDFSVFEQAVGRNVSRKRPQNFSKIFRNGILLTAILGIFTGCEASREEICRQFPAVGQEIAGVQAQIAILVPSRLIKNGRSIASAKAEAPDPGIANLEEFTLERRIAWLSWGEKALKRTQWVKDSLEGDKRGRKALPALNEAGLSLVSFHGFLDQRKWKKAVAELNRVESSLTRARKLACETETAPPKSKGRK